MNLRDYLSVLRKRWISIVIAVVVFTGLAVAYTLTSAKIYTAQAQSFVALSSTSQADQSALSGAQFAAQRVKSYTEIVSSPDVLAPVIAKLSLPYTVGQLAGMVSASNPPLTVLLNVTASSKSAEESAAIANATAIQMGRVIEALETPSKALTAPVKVSLINPATVPGAPSSPNTKINIALGLIVGLGVGLAWAFLRNAMDNTMKSESELEEISGVPILGAVAFDGDTNAHPMLAPDSKSARAEGYRTIRTNMQYVNVDNPPKVITVTSAGPGDGKSTTACNLALVFATMGYSVCLVEADLRRPRVSEYLGIDPSQGLTDVLAGQRTLDSVLQTWGRSGMSVLPPGELPPNPSELLGSEHMGELIQELRGKFQFVVMDTCPLLAVSDAAVLAAQTDGAIVVVRYGSSTRDQVEHAVGALEQVNTSILGTVLNAVPKNRGYGYGYSGYGYGYGYVDDPKSKAGKLTADAPTASA